MRLQLSQIRHRTRWVATVASAAFLLIISSAAVRAESNAYGCGDYNTNNYNSVCPTSSGGGSSGGGSSSEPASSTPGYESTVVQAPSGLEVAINLANGQEIPYAGYYITITPINGEGTTFDKAEIYIDGKLVYSSTPDSTGTLKWLWEPSKQPGTKVKIIIYGPGSGTTTHEFTVTIGKDLSQATTATDIGATTTPSTGGEFPWWGYVLIGGAVIAVIVIIWAIIRRRKQQSQLPPPTFTPMQ